MSAEQSSTETDERLRHMVMIVRQGLYFIADELGKEYGLERPCKRCDDQRRRRTAEPREIEPRPGRAA